MPKRFISLENTCLDKLIEKMNEVEEGYRLVTIINRGMHDSAGLQFTAIFERIVGEKAKIIEESGPN